MTRRAAITGRGYRTVNEAYQIGNRYDPPHRR